MIGKIPIKIYDDEVIGKAIKETGIWEPELTKFLSDFSFKKTNPIFLDIGAHIGYFSLLVGHNSFVKIHAFEPHPNIYKLLQWNTRLYPHIIAHNYAIANKVGEAQLFTSYTNTGDNSLIREEIEKWNQDQYGSEVIFTKKIHHFDIDLSRIELIKIDTQGTEHIVFDQVKDLINATFIIEKSDYINTYIQRNTKNIKLLLETPYDYVFCIENNE